MRGLGCLRARTTSSAACEGAAAGSGGDQPRRGALRLQLEAEQAQLRRAEAQAVAKDAALRLAEGEALAARREAARWRRAHEGSAAELAAAEAALGDALAQAAVARALLAAQQQEHGGEPGPQLVRGSPPAALPAKPAKLPPEGWQGPLEAAAPSCSELMIPAAWPGPATAAAAAGPGRLQSQEGRELHAVVAAAHDLLGASLAQAAFRIAERQAALDRLELSVGLRQLEAASAADAPAARGEGETVAGGQRLQEPHSVTAWPLETLGTQHGGGGAAARQLLLRRTSTKAGQPLGGYGEAPHWRCFDNCGFDPMGAGPRPWDLPRQQQGCAGQERGCGAAAAGAPLRRVNPQAVEEAAAGEPSDGPGQGEQQASSGATSHSASQQNHAATRESLLNRLAACQWRAQRGAGRRGSGARGGSSQGESSSSWGGAAGGGGASEDVARFFTELERGAAAAARPARTGGCWVPEGAAILELDRLRGQVAAMQRENEQVVAMAQEQLEHAQRAQQAEAAAAAALGAARSQMALMGAQVAALEEALAEARGWACLPSTTSELPFLVSAASTQAWGLMGPPLHPPAPPPAGPPSCGDQALLTQGDSPAAAAAVLPPAAAPASSAEEGRQRWCLGQVAAGERSGWGGAREDAGLAAASAAVVRAIPGSAENL